MKPVLVYPRFQYTTRLPWCTFIKARSYSWGPHVRIVQCFLPTFELPRDLLKLPRRQPISRKKCIGSLCIMVPKINCVTQLVFAKNVNGPSRRSILWLDSCGICTFQLNGSLGLFFKLPLLPYEHQNHGRHPRILKRSVRVKLFLYSVQSLSSDSSYELLESSFLSLSHSGELSGHVQKFV